MNDRRNQTTAWVLMAVSCVALFVTKLIPLLRGITMSFQNYSPMHGAQSPFVGMKNYNMLFGSFHFPSVIANTLRMNVISLLLAALLTFIGIWALSQVKNKKLYTLFAAIFAVPIMIPTVVLLKAIVVMDHDHLKSFTLYYYIIQALRLSSLAIVLSLVFRRLSGIKQALVGMATIGLVVLSQSLSANVEAVLLLGNPLTYQTMEVIQSYSYRAGLMTMQFGPAQAAWVFKTIIELFCTAAAVGLGYWLFGAVSRKKEQAKTNEKNPLGLVICALYALANVYLVVKVFLPTGGTIAPQGMVVGGLIYFFIMLVIAMVVSALGAVMAYPLTVKNTIIKIIYTIVLVVSCYFGTLSMHQFAAMRSAGLFDTLLAVILSDFMPVMLIYGFAVAYYSLRGERRSYASVILKPAIGATALIFATKWGSYIAPLVHTANPQNQPLALQYYMAMQQGGADISPAMTAMLVVPALLVLAGAAVLIAALSKKSDKIAE